MVTWTFMRSLGVSAGVYQSVMMTPPNGSAETSGMKLMVSSEARHRKAFTATPVPPLSSFSVGLGAEQAARPEQAALFAVAAAQALVVASRLAAVAVTGRSLFRDRIGIAAAADGQAPAEPRSRIAKN